MSLLSSLKFSSNIHSLLSSWYSRQFYALLTVLSNRKLSSELYPISLTIPASENDEDNK